MRFREARTINAISILRHAFPYAAALLSYVVVERVLKRHVSDHWTGPRYANAKIPDNKTKHGGKRLRELIRLTKTQRFSEVLCRLTLGDVEELVKRPQKQRSASDRNEIMHSNLYLKEESRLSRAKRQARNEIRFAKALKHLRRTTRQFAGYDLIDQNGYLAAQPNKRLKLTSGGR